MTARDGRVKVGDKLLAVNGQSLKGMTNPQVLAFLKQTPNTVTLTLSRPKKSSSSNRSPPPVAQKPTKPTFLLPPKVEPPPVEEKPKGGEAWPVKEEKQRKGLWDSISGSLHGGLMKKHTGDIDIGEIDLGNDRLVTLYHYKMIEDGKINYHLLINTGLNNVLLVTLFNVAPLCLVMHSRYVDFPGYPGFLSQDKLTGWIR